MVESLKAAAFWFAVAKVPAARSCVPKPMKSLPWPALSSVAVTRVSDVPSAIVSFPALAWMKALSIVEIAATEVRTSAAPDATWAAPVVVRAVEML